MPSTKRGWIGSLVTCVIPLGVGIGAVLGAYATRAIDWRGLCAVDVLPALLAPLVRVWVPESPRWLLRQGRVEEARESLAWALQVDPQSLPLPMAEPQPAPKTNWFDLSGYPRSLAVSWIGNVGANRRLRHRVVVERESRIKDLVPMHFLKSAGNPATDVPDPCRPLSSTFQSRGSVGQTKSRPLKP
jgi:MFS family permease